MATSATTISELQVIPFHNCKGCRDKFKRAFRKLNGVDLIDMDPEDGIFTISTLENPEVIRVALQKKFRKKSIILLPEINRLNTENVGFGPPPPTTEPSAPPMPPTDQDDYVIGYPFGPPTNPEDYVIGYPFDLRYFGR